MLQVKLPYYPKVIAYRTETPFGVQEITTPEIYEKPIASKTIVRVDLLDCLRDILDAGCFVNREFLYTIMSGSDANYVPQEIFASFYRKFPNVRSYINELYHFGDSSTPLFDRCVNPLVERVRDHREVTLNTFMNSGAKYLVETHDYIYFSFVNKDAIPDVNGVKIIC